MKSTRAKPRGLALAIILAGLLAVPVALATHDPYYDEPEPPASAFGRPNIVVITTDDQGLDLFDGRRMPKTWKRIVKSGTRFENAIVTTPLCCPARAAFLTGQYGHNNGVLRNRYGDLLEPGNVLPAWLRRAGYRTVHVGKWLNYYEDAVPDRFAAAPGWDRWWTVVGQPRYYKAKLSIDGRKKKLGRAPRELLTKELGRLARGAVRRFTAGPQPLYLQLDFYAPHASGRHRIDRCRPKAPEPARSEFKRFRSEKLPRPKSFNERVIEDKPAWARGLPRIGQTKRRRLIWRYRCASGSVRTADTEIGKLLRTLVRAGELGNTIVVFTSDNGYMDGEHRMIGKGRPYEEALRVPLAIRVPRSVSGRRAVPTVRAPVANIDLAPTLLAYAGADPCLADGHCRPPDGRRLNRLIRGSVTGWGHDRLLLVERDTTPDSDGIYDPADPYYDEAEGGQGHPCRFEGIWTPQMTYTVYREVAGPGEEECARVRQVEIYDTRHDPLQLHALEREFETRRLGRLGRDTLRGRLEQLRDCATVLPTAPNPCS